jgi:gamma-glutamyl-gamma-aminobutyrate hydrolase PuuD
MPEPSSPPMGRLDAFDVGEKKLTVQTEFFSRPDWRVETKVYLAGALKKVYKLDLAATAEEELQKRVNAFHQAKIDEIAEGLRARKS